MPDILNVEVEVMNVKVGRYEVISDGTAFNTKVFCNGVEQKGIEAIVISIDVNDGRAKILMSMSPFADSND